MSENDKLTPKKFTLGPLEVVFDEKPYKIIDETLEIIAAHNESRSKIDQQFKEQLNRMRKDYQKAVDELNRQTSDKLSK
jgi:F0F1-type ATP synthase membrane subunit b/b'